MCRLHEPMVVLPGLRGRAASNLAGHCGPGLLSLTCGAGCEMGSGGLPGRLPGELTEFVGRRAELALVRQALGSARMVTLTGPGGIGKTRLALRAASGARRARRHGVCLARPGGV